MDQQLTTAFQDPEYEQRYGISSYWSKKTNKLN